MPSIGTTHLIISGQILALSHSRKLKIVQSYLFKCLVVSNFFCNAIIITIQTNKIKYKIDAKLNIVLYFFRYHTVFSMNVNVLLLYVWYELLLHSLYLFSVQGQGHFGAVIVEWQSKQIMDALKNERQLKKKANPFREIYLFQKISNY